MPNERSGSHLHDDHLCCCHFDCLGEIVKLSDIFFEAMMTLPTNKRKGICNHVADVFFKHDDFTDIKKALEIIDLLSPDNMPSDCYWFATSIRTMVNHNQEKIWKLKDMQARRIDLLAWCYGIAKSEGL